MCRTLDYNKRISEHDLRAQFLDSLAVLMGYKEVLERGLPDGLRPDVLRLCTGGNRIFIGDAKDTEPPVCAETQVRLNRYMRWLAVFIRRGGRGVFAISFTRTSDLGAWCDTLKMLAYEAGIVISSIKYKAFGRNYNVIAITCCG